MRRIELSRDFEHVWPLAAEALGPYMGRLGTSAHRIEDLIQETRIRLWQRRESLCFDSNAQWLTYAKLVADNIARDTYHKELRELPMSDTSDRWEDSSSASFVSVIESALESEGLLAAADDLWLGERPDGHDLRLLAATLLVRDNRRSSEVLTLLRRDGRLAGEELPALIGGRRTLLELAYRSLHIQSNAIAVQVLGAKLTDLPKVVSVINRGRTWRGRTGTWTAFDAKVALRKCCDFESTSVILRSYSHEKHTDVVAVTVRLRSHLPFISTMKSLREQLAPQGIPMSCYAESGLWKRLAFQYVSGDGLPHLDFVDWFSPVAAEAGYPLTAERLHTWISIRRLASELRKELMKAWGGPNELNGK